MRTKPPLRKNRQGRPLNLVGSNYNGPYYVSVTPARAEGRSVRFLKLNLGTKSGTRSVRFLSLRNRVLG